MELQRVCFNLKNALGNYFTVETLHTEFTCFPVKKQPIEPYTKKIKIAKFEFGRFWEIVAVETVDGFKIGLANKFVDFSTKCFRKSSICS